MNTIKAMVVPRSPREVAHELLVAYSSLVPLCRNQGLNVAEMQAVIDRAKAELNGQKAA